jgi:transglutaminase-like putative cysteine protease
MTVRFSRRAVLQAGAAAAVPAWAGMAAAQEHRFQPEIGAWRTFDVVTTVEVAAVKGVSRVWLPVPDVNSDYQKSLDNTWKGNADVARVVTDATSGVRMFYAEFSPSVSAPTVTLTSRVQTRNRAVDWEQPSPGREDDSTLKTYLQPAELIPTDGIVRQTALAATQGAKTDYDKVRALYDWVVANAHREPKVKGCGVGDIKALLETQNMGGKCADLNALFVGMSRSLGIPARDVYGLRVAPSAFGYRELGANPASLKGAQHCRAEVYLKTHGWVAMDPADVLKVARQETPDWIKDNTHPLVSPVKKGLFGRWEGNWVGFNTGHDVRLPNSTRKQTLPFLMYPNGENADGPFDQLAPDAFRYTIVSREVAA